MEREVEWEVEREVEREVEWEVEWEVGLFHLQKQLRRRHFL
jgi:hypothetical protein